MQFADVALHRRVPKQFDTFTYQILEGTVVQRGQFVRVPFRKQTLSGIVRKIHHEKPTYPIKFITERATLFLTETQLQLAEWMSAFYQCPFSKVIDVFVPEKVWKNSVISVPFISSSAKAGNLLDPPVKPWDDKNEQLLTKTINSLLSSPTPKLLLEHTPLPRHSFYDEIIKAIPKDSQILFVFPEVFFLKQLAPKGSTHFHGELSEWEKALLWHAVRNGETRIIAATRAGIFLPFKKLGAIILDFEHNENYAEKREPRYHALPVVSELSKFLKIPLIIVSATPRVETYHTAKQGIYEKHEWRKNDPPTVNIVDMGNERRKGNFGIFAQVSREKIAATLAQKKQILLFLHRKGEASALLCSDCGTVFRCEACSGAFTVHSGNQFYCHRCNIKKSIPASCKNCGNVQLKRLGAGTEMGEKEIQKIFSKARVLRLDRELLSQKNARNLDLKKLRKTDIIIATKIIEKPLDLPRLALGIALMPDPLLHMPHLRASERVFQLLTHIRHLLAPDGEMLIQTFIPEYLLWKCMKENRLEDFYGSELDSRKSLSLPPFNHLQQ